MASATEQAVRRLDAALQSLEIAIQHRLAHVGGPQDDSEEVQMLGADRARLAEQLDQSQARAAKLETATRDASRRLGAAAEMIRSILDSEPERS